MAAIAVTDAYGKVVLCETRQKSYDGKSFFQFIKKFYQKERGYCTLVLDNLSFHRSKEVREFCDEKDIKLIYNGIYSS